jgi:site-specific recombinase XerD
MDLAKAAEQYREMVPWVGWQLATFLRTCPVDDTSALRATDTVVFLRSLAERGYALGTIRVYRTVVNNFFRWLLERQLVSFGPEALKEAFREQSSVVPRRVMARYVAPEEGEVRRLIEAAYAAVPPLAPDTPRGKQRHLTYLRNIALVETFRATGVRTGELVALRRCDLDVERQVAYAPDGRELVFDLQSWAALARYLAARGDPVRYPLLVWQAPVFARHDSCSVGRGLLPLGTKGVGRILQGLGGSGPVRPRDLRIRFGQRLLAATADVKGTAELLGLKDMPHVRRYGAG